MRRIHRRDTCCFSALVGLRGESWRERPPRLYSAVLASRSQPPAHLQHVPHRRIRAIAHLTRDLRRTPPAPASSCQIRDAPTSRSAPSAHVPHLTEDLLRHSLKRAREVFDHALDARSSRRGDGRGPGERGGRLHPGGPRVTSSASGQRRAGSSAQRRWAPVLERACHPPRPLRRAPPRRSLQRPPAELRDPRMS